MDSVVVWNKMEELPKNVEFILDDSKPENLLTLRHVKTKQTKKRQKNNTVFKLWPIGFKTLYAHFSFTPKEHL